MTTNEQDTRLTSKELAELIVDALFRAGIVQEASARLAIEVAAEEIDARKAMGDY